MKRLFLLALAGIILVTPARPDPPTIKDWKPIRAQQPAGLAMQMSLLKTHFFQGEEIKATLVFSNTSDKPYHTWIGTYDRSGRIVDIGFHAEDEHGDEAPDPLAWYLDRNFGLGGGLGNDSDLGEWEITLAVNQWLRFDHPGVYHLWAWSKRVQHDKYSVGVPETGQPISLVSDRITITIDPLTPQDEQSVLDQAKQALAKEAAKTDSSALNAMFPMPNQDLYDSLCRLSYLRTPAAIQLLLPTLSQGNGYGSCAADALLGARDPKAEAPVLLASVAKGQPFLDQFVIHVYTALKTYGAAGFIDEMTIYENGKPVPPRANDPVVLAHKEIEAAANQAASGNEAAAASASWAAFQTNSQDPAVRAELAKHQLALSPSQRAELLNRWSYEVDQPSDPVNHPASGLPNYGGPDLLPVVRQMANAPECDPYALKILAHLAPDEARPLIVADIKRPVWQYINKAKVHFPTPIGLDALPVKPIPELTDAFRHWLMVKDMDPDMVLPLLDRYGTDDLLPDVKLYYQPLIGHLSCFAEGACLRFWIRHEPEAGMAALQQALHTRVETRCYTMLLDYVLKGHWSPLAEPMVVKDLSDLDADFVITAIKILEDNGSAQAVEPVIAALERIHSTVPPKINDEEPLDIQRQQEAHLAQDLLASTRWSYTAPQKARLQKISATAN